MASNQHVNKVQYGGNTLIDLTGDDVQRSDVRAGVIFHLPSGEQTTGTASSGGAVTITDTLDEAGGTIRTITGIVVAGTKQITTNGVQDVTEYASVNVNVPTGGANLETRTGVNPSTSSQTLTPGAGFDGFSSVQINAMPSGTAGTPTATKGTVSNHSVTVTPSVTNTTGYITGSTKTGTGVSVSASELVSGSETKTANGTYDVTNLASVVVNVASTVSVDTKTETASNYPVSLEFTGMEGEPKMFTLRLNASVSSSGSTTYYYIVNITSHGTTTHGNCFRVGSTRQVTSVTSGYSWSYSGTTLTITSSAASRSVSPGAFYSGSYELMYVY